ncbi:MAG: hypothetical protein ACLQE9_21050 [Roseiarcus sp.]
MAAPAVVALLAFLGGSGTAGAALPALTAAAKTEAVVAGVYADLPAICRASDPLIDALGDAWPKSPTLARLAAVADAVCAAAQKPNDPVDQARLVIDAIEALRAAKSRLAEAAPKPVAGPTTSTVGGRAAITNRGGQMAPGA